VFLDENWLYLNQGLAVSSEVEITAAKIIQLGKLMGSDRLVRR
jgi:hypothetical protein